MDRLQENFGFIYYRTHLHGPLENEKLRLFEVNDFVQIWCNQTYMGSQFRPDGKTPILLPDTGEKGITLELLVENGGRINYGPYVGFDSKGIAHGVCLEMQYRFDWFYKTLPMNDLSKLKFGSFDNNNGQVRFHRGFFDCREKSDGFILIPRVKGLVWVNGFNLGRYWNVGPTKTLYLPKTVLKNGKNEIIILELEELEGKTIHIQDFPIL